MTSMHPIDKALIIFEGSLGLLLLRYVARIAYQALTKYTADYKEDDNHDS